MANEFDIDNLKLELLANRVETPISTFTQKSVDPSYDPLENPDASDALLRFLNMATTHVDLGPMSDILKPFAKGIHATGRGLEAIGDIVRESSERSRGSDIEKGLIDAAVGATDFLLADPLQHILGPEGEVSLLDAAIFAPGVKPAVKFAERVAKITPSLIKLGVPIMFRKGKKTIMELKALRKLAEKISGYTQGERRSQLLSQLDHDIESVYKHYASDEAFERFNKNYSKTTGKSLTKKEYDALVDAQFKGIISPSDIKPYHTTEMKLHPSDLAGYDIKTDKFSKTAMLSKKKLSDSKITPPELKDLPPIGEGLPSVSDIAWENLGLDVGGSFYRGRRGIKLDQYGLYDWQHFGKNAKSMKRLKEISSVGIHEWTHMIHSPKAQGYFTKTPSWLKFEKEVVRNFSKMDRPVHEAHSYMSGIENIVNKQQRQLAEVHIGASKSIIPRLKNNKQIQKDVELKFENKVKAWKQFKETKKYDWELARTEIYSDESYLLGFGQHEIPIDLISDDLLNKMGKKYGHSHVEGAYKFLGTNQDDVFMGEIMARLSEIRLGKRPADVYDRLSDILNKKDIDWMLDNIWGAAPVMGMGSFLKE